MAANELLMGISFLCARCHSKQHPLSVSFLSTMTDEPHLTTGLRVVWERNLGADFGVLYYRARAREMASKRSSTWSQICSDKALAFARASILLSCSRGRLKQPQSGIVGYRLNLTNVQASRQWPVHSGSSFSMTKFRRMHILRGQRA